MNNNNCIKYLIIAIITLLFLSILSSVVSSKHLENNIKSDEFIEIKLIQSENFASEVWVDDDYYDGGYNGGHTWGYDAFDNIRDGIFNVSDSGTVHIHEGIYDPFEIDGRTDILINSVEGEEPVVVGSQQVWDSTASIMVNCVIFVNDSNNIYLQGLDIQGSGLNGRSYAVFLY